MKITRVGGVAALLVLTACSPSTKPHATFPTGYGLTPAAVAKGLHGYCASVESAAGIGKCQHTHADTPSLLIGTYPSADQQQLTLAAIDNGANTAVPTLCRVVLKGVTLQGNPASALRQAVGNVPAFAAANHGQMQGAGC